MNKVSRLGMLFSEGNVPDFGSIQMTSKNTNIYYLLAQDIPKLNGMLTRATSAAYLPEGQSFNFYTGALAYVVDYKTAGSGKIYMYHRGQDHWYEFNIRSDLGLCDFMWERHARILRETKTISSTPPLTFESNGRPLKNYRIYGNTQNIDGKLVGVGDLVTDENDVHFGTYKVSFSIGSLSQNIYLDQPLWKNGDYVDYLDFSEQKVYRRVKYKKLTGQEDGWVTSRSYPGSFYLSWNILNGLFNCPFICNSAQSVLNLSQYIKGKCYSDNTLNIRIMDPETTMQEWKNYLASRVTENDPLSIVYTTSVQEDINTVLPSVHPPRQTCILSFNTMVKPSQVYIKT